MAATIALLLTLALQDSPDAASLASYSRWLETRRAALIEVRRDLHRHPELSGEEARTAEIVARRLRAAGLEVRSGLGGHGVVGVLKGARPGPVVAYRADMDAVRSIDPDPVDFRSLDPGKRHICGHDVHTTIGLALAEGLASLRAEISGTLVFVFQPAEENGAGARALLDQQALDDPRPAALFALHTSPFEVGEFATAEGVLMAGRDRALVTVKGTGALAEVAQELAGEARALGTIAQGQLFEPVSLEEVRIEARAQRESDQIWQVLLIVTSGSRETRADVRGAVEALVAELARPDVALTLDYAARFLPGVENDPALVRAASAQLRAEFGPNSVRFLSGVVPAFSEDFGFFQDLAPGVLIFLGVSNTKNGTAGMPHTPDFVADEEAIFVGARGMARVLLGFLETR